MNLVKWIRRNNTKVMAAVVILLMVGFVAQAFFTQCRQQRTAPRRTFAYFADNSKITNIDLAMARHELETLKLLRTDSILRGIVTPIFQTRDLPSITLAGLLFPDRTISPIAMENVKQMVAANPYQVSEKQIDDIYRPSMPNEIYWILLKNEAHLAGIRLPKEAIRTQLERTIPQVFNGATYSQVIGSIANRQSVSEEEILDAFGNVLSVLKYAEMICSNQNLTLAQIRHEVSWEKETIDIDFVKFDSAVFAKTSDEPSEEEIIRHFDKYKAFFAGDISGQNPYGFGYKLHDRVRLEYIAVKLNDVKKIVTAPTQEEIEEFYQRHRQELTVSVPSNPDDPNSPLVEQIKSYGEVAGAISQNLLNKKINSKAESILQEARTITELGLQDMSTDPEKITPEEFKQLAGDYKITADQLSTKYKINVYYGKTVPLNAIDLVNNKTFGTMFVKSRGNTPVALIRILLAADGLKASELGPFDPLKPRLYENIGLVKDILGQTMMIVRVTEAKKASEPESINQTIAPGQFELGEPQQTSSIKDKIVEDLKKLAAVDITKSKAEEFIKLAAENDWENTIDEFNKLYPKRDKQAGEDTNTFELHSLKNVQRVSDETLETLATKKKGAPTAWWLVRDAKVEQLLVDQLYSLLPEDGNTADILPFVLEFKPDMTCYCLKNLSFNRFQREQFDAIKAAKVYKEDFIQSQSLALIHFNPDNILKRMNFRMVEEDNAPTDVNTPTKAEGDS